MLAILQLVLFMHIYNNIIIKYDNNNIVVTRSIPSASRNTKYQIEIKAYPYKRALIFQVFVF